MRVGMFPVDGHNFPSIPLMKLSAYHKSIGDSTELYQPFTGHYDRVYCSKVFSFTPDYELAIDATEVIHGGTGYAISNVGGANSITKNWTLPFRQKQNTSILTTISLGSQIPHTASFQEDAPVGVSFVS